LWCVVGAHCDLLLELERGAVGRRGGSRHPGSLPHLLGLEAPPNLHPCFQSVAVALDRSRHEKGRECRWYYLPAQLSSAACAPSRRLRPLRSACTKRARFNAGGISILS